MLINPVRRPLRDLLKGVCQLKYYIYVCLIYNDMHRRLKCFHHFIGTTGRTKNMSVFYCFIRWEGCSTTHNTRRLRSGGRSSSDAGGSEGSEGTPPLRVNGVFNVKETRQIQALAAIFTSPSGKAPSTAATAAPTDNGIQMAKKRMLEEETRSVRAARIQSARTSVLFDDLTAEQKAALTASWFDTIMGELEKK